MKCPGELTCALACDTLIDCRVAKGYDETAEIGCVHACKRDVFVNGTVILTSPYFPENYKNDLECDYTLKAPEGHFIQIAFTSFDIEADFRCSYDYFMVFDSGSKSALRINGFRKICGSIDPNQLPVLNTTEGEARVIFETDGGVVAKGWNLTLEAIPIEVETGINRTKRSNSDWDSGFTSTPSSGWGDFWGDTSAAGWTMNTQDDQTTPTTTTTYDIYSGSSYHESYSTYFDYDYYYDTGDLFVDAASFDKITKNDWIEAVHLSNMPDFSDFKAFVKLSNAEIIGNGHQREAFIVQCVLDGKSCSHEIFTTIQDKDFGNCFSFNSFKQIKNEEPYSTTKTGFASGLKLTLFVVKDEYIGIFGQNSGARLTISNPRDFPPINTKALYLSAGFDTTLTLSQEWVIRAEHPFSNCTPSWPKHVEASKEAQMFTYTQDFCNALCQESTLSLVCNCSQISIFAFSANAEVSRNSRNYCDPWNKDQFKCVEDVLADFSMNKRMCDCPEPCQERSLKVTSSSSEWPTEAYAPYLAYLLRRSPSERVRKFIEYAVKATASSNSNPTLSEILRKNFVRVEIYFENMNYFKIEEMPKYNVSLLFGTLGGNMGLWLGWSIMALFELVQWIITCCSILLSKT